MRTEGVLLKWNDGRGFGFISPVQGGQEIFVHISVFPQDGLRPTVGEKLSFEIETDDKGKKRAKNLVCLDRTTIARVSVPRRSSSRPQKEKPSFLGRVIPILIFIGIFVYGFGEYSRRQVPLPAATAMPEFKELTPRSSGIEPAIETHRVRIEPTSELASKSEVQGATTAYQCDGRTHCSQMTSCAEAKYFLRNCPNVEMDGDNDGVPCEKQWCPGPFAK